MPETRERWRFRLPHWEVFDRPHFVTVRCAGSLPAEVAARMRETHVALQCIEPASPQLAWWQRQYFVTCEKFLDRGEGFAPFSSPSACRAMLGALGEWDSRAGWTVTEGVIMPNHVHLLVVPSGPEAMPLRRAVREFKGRTARSVNRILGRQGSLWQSDWFDRWIRHDEEHRRVVDYIRRNPVKAGLVAHWRDWLWRCSSESAAGG